ncbi:ubiquitin carboxyl-terminal hydrolase 25-like isoform X4 [Dermacentor silvarum]|uniref:ubiquitin carboxyl-terminal hydrolase 25-like isoform X4 n=1 Tax=Dermacentor silvarum TaxID=543639 RepID=UPI002100D6A7|nr:ubiquitin carboxyl-terminal hydrolase 25-like isoform X4 [Dermacentor silvarum]
MTVEHSPLDSHAKKVRQQQQQQEETIRQVINQLKEITGVEDPAILGQALEASRTVSGNYDLTHAISMLVEEDGGPSVSQVGARPQVAGDGAAAPGNHPGAATSPQKRPAKVVDLTGEGDDLQKAIALSLQEQQVAGVSAEEQDISRALEQSLGGKRKRGADAWLDPANPYERRRLGDWPVGIKNVGNTCWFSAVIQSLYHLPMFRRLVLAFEPLRASARDGRPLQEQRSLGLMLELRPLFALLAASRRKYVDPGRALELLRDAFVGTAGGAGGSQGPNNQQMQQQQQPHPQQQPSQQPQHQPQQQQDVSEFTHKLLEWLEDAFQLAHCAASPGSIPRMEQTNPMLDLFYGRFRCEGENEGRHFSREEAFGQYPLQVNGFSDIHDSLEAATTSLEPESASTPSSRRLGQETWFTKLPPVLVFELSRFRFNQHLNKPEKIHHRLDFPELLYMDRYMEYNKNITRSKREEVRRLKAERERLRRQLDNLGVGSPGSSPPDEGHSRGESPRNVNEGPCPRHVAEPELRLLQSCLRRWRSEVEHDVKELQDSMSRIDATIRDIYTEPSLLQVPYRLHAVLVHEGQAASGHYWAFVYCPHRAAWLKFNDVTVSEVTWAELLRDSVGGHHCTSAYCLLYVDRSNRDLFDGAKDSELQLPPDLAQYVEADNAAFRRELEQWDLSHRDKVTVDAATSGNDIVVTPVQSQQDRPMPTDLSSGGGVLSASPSWPALQQEHAQLAQGWTQGRLAQLGTTLAAEGPRGALAKALDQELARLQRLARVAQQRTAVPPWPNRSSGTDEEDPRLQHIGLFLLLNGAPVQPYLHRVLLEQFAQPDLEKDPIGAPLRQEALRWLTELSPSGAAGDVEMEAVYRGWHVLYCRFRHLASALTIGLEHYWAHRLPSAVHLLGAACTLNEALLARPPPAEPHSRYLGFDPRLLTYCRRMALLALNEYCARQFEEGSLRDALGALRLMTDTVLPHLAPLLSPLAGAQDTRAIEEVRSRWCAMLGLAMPDEKQEQLEDMLSKLLDPGVDTPPMSPLSIPRVTNLSAAYEQAMRRLTSSKHFEAALHEEGLPSLS